MNKLLSIITPFYASSEDSYLNNRIKIYIEESYYPDWMERIIVDFGSPEKISNKVSDICEKHGYIYLNLKKGRERFSAGKCRNIGAQIAKGEYLSFSDVDLLADEEMYKSIYKKIKKENHFNFFELIPCFYLTEDASLNYLDKKLKHHEIYNAYLNDDKNIIKATAPATSCFLLKKDFFLSEGGMRDDFFGHGYEDFELLNRLAIKSNKFYRSHDYYSHVHRYDSLEYKGYRTFFSLFGRENLAKGDYYVHIYHEPAKDSGYKESSARNRKIFEDYLLSFDSKKDSPPALDNLVLDNNVLILGWKNSIPFKGLRELIPLLGKIFYRHEKEFVSSEDFVEFVKNKSIDKVLFLNPYGNEQRLDIYKRCKKEGIDFIVYDRGALPGSWFFDTNGFNAESKSYAEEVWKKDLDDNENYLVETYINNFCSSAETLEENGERLGAYALRKKYSCIDKKILFVPLQRPNDTVIKYFSGAVSGVEDFISRIRILAASLPAEWTICVKQHPLENYTIDIPGCIVVDESTHVHDLIEAADAILLINSGVGLISLCFGKPVFCFGESFYSGDGLAKKINQDSDLKSYIVNYKKYIPNEKIVKCFIHYLISDFYSFAATDYLKIPEDDGKKFRSMAISLNFDNIRINGFINKTISRRYDLISTKAPAYDYYRAYFSREKEKSSYDFDKNPEEIKKSAIPVAADNAQRSSIRKEGSFKRKIRKLIRDPKLFIKDALRKL